MLNGLKLSKAFRCFARFAIDTVLPALSQATQPLSVFDSLGALNPGSDLIIGRTLSCRRVLDGAGGAATR